MNTPANLNPIEKLAQSPDIFDACEKIGAKFGLHIDQIGELDAQIRDILRGKAKSQNFTSDIQKCLEIDRALAEKITDEANKEIFQTIKSKLQGESLVKSAPPSALERAGGFVIEQKPASGAGEMRDIKENDRAAELSTVEKPFMAPIAAKVTLKPATPATPPAIPTASVAPSLPMTKKEPLTEPLVDHLLARPAVQSQEKIVRKVESAPVAPTAPAPQPTKRSGPDPYKESIV